MSSVPTAHTRSAVITVIPHCVQRPPRACVQSHGPASGAGNRLEQSSGVDSMTPGARDNGALGAIAASGANLNARKKGKQADDRHRVDGGMSDVRRLLPVTMPVVTMRILRPCFFFCFQTVSCIRVETLIPNIPHL